MANYRIGQKRREVMWSNNVTEGNGRLVFRGDLEFAMDRSLANYALPHAQAGAVRRAGAGSGIFLNEQRTRAVHVSERLASLGKAVRPQLCPVCFTWPCAMGSTTGQGHGST
jgi:hypothetical protein